MRTMANCLALLIAVFAMAPRQSPGQSSTKAVPAVLVEAHEFEPCDWNCGIANHPTTAYCVKVGLHMEVGEHSGWLWFGEDDSQSLRAQVNSTVMYEARAGSFQLSAGGHTIRVSRGTKFEDFHDAACRAEVHKFKLTAAVNGKLPALVPRDAVAIAGAYEGDYRPDFVWLRCTVGKQTIDCKKWYPNGSSRGIEHYCLTTRLGQVPIDFKLDPIASAEGKLVLDAGEPLQFDHRGRINDELQNANEACH